MDIEEHELVPDHEVMGEGEVEELLEEYQITRDAEPGDVIRIERDSPTAGETTYYRRVVED
ncbi:MAG: DNA-directed RNA polymerase subunit RpoH/Rpb5 C-terminal domain-containing protein [Candidatus Nanohaloarchaea archaeon]|nr:DNA-directed RNA polymerase subunit RpoH/Rpb5 C-terminal domain-containing protein [Candidatus Nanohaloarchaea archaeon]